MLAITIKLVDIYVGYLIYTQAMLLVWITSVLERMTFEFQSSLAEKVVNFMVIAKRTH